jgi:hypothetical protein
MTHHVQFPPYLPRGKIDGEPHPADAAERSVLGQTVRGIEHHVLAVVQRILRSNSALEWQCFPAALFSLENGSTTAKRPRRHPTWRRAILVWRNRTRHHRRLDASSVELGPDERRGITELNGEGASM